MLTSHIPEIIFPINFPRLHCARLINLSRQWLGNYQRPKLKALWGLYVILHQFQPE